MTQLEAWPPPDWTLNMITRNTMLNNTDHNSKAITE